MRGVVFYKEQHMEHKFLRNFNAEGQWTKPSRTIRIHGVEHDMDEYAKEHGIKLPDSKSKQHKDIKKEVNTNADMGQQDNSRDTKIDGDGDSEGSE
tara:strand:- start:2576 stop:2863 length:288 start_codon:yes stop_codon:yes gene_type:complete